MRANHTPTPSDDVYALAATLFYAITEKQPFSISGSSASDDQLGWPPGMRAMYPRFADFAAKATHIIPAQRFENAIEALLYLGVQEPSVGGKASAPGEVRRELPVALSPNEVPRLKDILSAYPGSRFGNAETRGLDSEFAINTYVETELDTWLPEAILERKISLIILCGNAGDGKTAFLQHLANKIGLPSVSSTNRIWEGTLSGGLTIKINLDGAASWNGRTADELLDELFKPFHQGPAKSGRVHLVAVNDGRLMEWVEAYEQRNGESALTQQLASALRGDLSDLEPHIRLIELNRRSLVGGLGDGHISTDFFDSLIYRLIGGENASEIWQPCSTCSAKEGCIAARSARILGAGGTDTERRQGNLLRKRLITALQAVHQRNEVHITTRELKAALSYILFGINYCTDLHSDPDMSPSETWQLAFDPTSPSRQGEVLRELTRLDPGLESQARADRYLQGNSPPDPNHGAPRYPDLPLDKARRRAFFEWTDVQISAVCGAEGVFGLARGLHFGAFRDFPLLDGIRQKKICAALCGGTSRLEELPRFALRRSGVIPIRIVPRTPIETAFWVEKPLERFSLTPERFVGSEGLETLHRYLELRYDSRDGRVETLIVSLSLFVLLMDLSEGAQIADAFSDDVFANLSVFTQRLAQEDETHMLAWNPAVGGELFEARLNRTPGGQILSLKSIGATETR